MEVGKGTIDGEPSTVAYVTVANPTNQLYSMKLLVHTQGTDGSFYGAAMPTGENETIKVELLEDLEAYTESDAKIAGEARLYVNRPSMQEGALDQVEFVGEIDGETSHWNTSYEPVRGPWRENRYHYENESVPEPGEQVLPDQLRIPALAALGFVGLLLVRRLTS
ncbi:hypothetical protein ACFQH6_12780 [Halobacteriaceae archaeon GCM10025711]